MRIVLSPTKEEAVKTIATLVVDKLSSHPTAVIGLATGKTMEPVYVEWVREAKERKLDLSRSFYFMLDEYLGIDVENPASFRSYIKSRLQSPLSLRLDQFAFPPVQLGRNESGPHYENLIKEAGGIDLQLLGIGQNGHIGFNEPGSRADSRTRVVSLTEDTRRANGAHFAAGKVPTEALSMGVASIKDAKELLMLATGSSKADAIKYLFNHHDDSSCPATFLKSHPHFTLVLDPEAASKISLKI